MPAVVQHHLLLRHAGLLEVVGAEDHADAGQLVAYRDEPGPIVFLLIIEKRVARLLGEFRPVVANGVGELGEQGDLLVRGAGHFLPGHTVIGQERGATGGVDQHLGVKLLSCAIWCPDG